jgi:hypothetical protein
MYKFIHFQTTLIEGFIKFYPFSQTNRLTVTAQSCARQTLNDLGHSAQWETMGHWNHKLEHAIF